MKNAKCGSRTLTAQQIEELVEMRNNGCTCEEIAAKLYISASTVSLIGRQYGAVPKKRVRRKCIYPALKDWMNRNGVSVEKFAKMANMSDSGIISIICGRSQPTKWTIDRILKITGLAYEQAFKEE